MDVCCWKIVVDKSNNKKKYTLVPKLKLKGNNNLIERVPSPYVMLDVGSGLQPLSSMSQTCTSPARVPSFSSLQGSLKYVGSLYSPKHPSSISGDSVPGASWAWMPASVSTVWQRLSSSNIRHNSLFLLLFWRLRMQSLDMFSCQL